MTRCRDQRSDALDKQVILSLAGWSRMVGGFIRLLRTSGNLKASKSLILEFSNSLRLRLTENRASVHPLSLWAWGNLRNTVPEDQRQRCTYSKAIADATPTLASHGQVGGGRD